LVIQDTAEGVASVIALECVDDLLVSGCGSEVAVLQRCSSWIFGNFFCY